jgi:two-component system, OmpR family, alkaline phosphatase synthesis response regulator PhoP
VDPVHGFTPGSPDSLSMIDTKPYVLIVEDDRSIALSLEYFLCQEGFQVAVVDDGKDVLPSLEGRRPDVILLDVMLPSHDGFELCQMIRARPEWETIPIIIVSAKGRDVDIEKGFSMGATDYIIKPFGLRALVDTVRQYSHP